MPCGTLRPAHCNCLCWVPHRRCCSHTSFLFTCTMALSLTHTWWCRLDDITGISSVGPVLEISVAKGRNMFRLVAESDAESEKWAWVLHLPTYTMETIQSAWVMGVLVSVCLCIVFYGHMVRRIWRGHMRMWVWKCVFMCEHVHVAVKIRKSVYVCIHVYVCTSCTQMCKIRRCKRICLMCV